MQDLLLTNVKALHHVANNGQAFLRGRELKSAPGTENAWLLIKSGKIADYGTGQPPEVNPAVPILNCEQSEVIPSFVDSHTHLIYAGNREQEFKQRLEGKTYAEIAAAGGGILNSARRLRESSEEELFESAWLRLQSLLSMGTGALEIKSGYGLSLDAELKMLRTARRLRAEAPIPIKSTFLGAHAVPSEYQNKREAYINLIIDEMLPAIAAENLADYLDVFCEENYFSVAEMNRLIEAGQAYGLKAKLHLNQFSSLGSIEEAVKRSALSVDHLETMQPADFEALRATDTITTLLPGCSFFLNIPYAPARQLIDQDNIVALATDFNPGSAPGGNMAQVFTLACTQMKMTPEEALAACTLNGAAAIELSHQVGSIEVGKQANLLILKPGYSPTSLAYHFGHPLIDKVLINGEILEDAELD